MSFKRLVNIYPDGITSNDTFNTGDIIVNGTEVKFKDLLINADTAKEATIGKTIRRIGNGEYATASDSALTFTAQEIGTTGNGITCTISASTEAEAISVSVTKKAITVTCPATTVEEVTTITSTASQVATAINDNYRAKKLVECTAGIGTVTAKTYTLAGGSDVPAGIDGELRFDNDRLYIYVNNTWKSVAIA